MHERQWRLNVALTASHTPASCHPSRHSLRTSSPASVQQFLDGCDTAEGVIHAELATNALQVSICRKQQRR